MNTQINSKNSRRSFIMTSTITAIVILVPNKLISCDSGDFKDIAKKMLESALLGTISAKVAGTIALVNPVTGVILGVVAVTIAVAAVSKGQSGVSKLKTCTYDKMKSAISAL